MITPEHWLNLGRNNPYDAPEDWDETTPVEPTDWATQAARGVIRELSQRRGFGMAFDVIEDDETRAGIVTQMAAIIRAAGPSGANLDGGQDSNLRKP